MVVARRRNRRRPLLIVLTVILAAAIGASVVSGWSAREPERELGWLDAMRPVVERSNELGKEVDGLRGKAGALDRPTLRRRLERFEAEARAMLAEATSHRAPRSLAAAEGLLVSCLAIRLEAVEALAPAFDAALGDGPPDDAAARLEAVGRDVQVADRAYQLFLGSLPRYDQPVTVPSEWVPDPAGWERVELAAFVAQLRSSRTRGPVHDLAVLSIAIDPPAAGKQDGHDVLPVVSSLRVRIVVANVGNEPVEGVVVLASLLGPDRTLDTARDFVDLEPGQRTAIRLGGLVPVTDTPLVLSVKVGPVDEEASLEDNELRRPIILPRRPATTTSTTSTTSATSATSTSSATAATTAPGGP